VVDLCFDGELTYWRGPSPWHFVAVPAEACERIAAVAPRVTYGWGCIPATVRIGQTRFTTSLFPKEGGYMVPVKTHVRRAEDLELGDAVTVELRLG
jgi:hypothetical protein